MIGIAVIAALTGVILTEMGCKSKRAFITLSLVVMLLGLCGELAVIFSQITSFGELSGVGEVAECALKVVGLGYVFGISCEICEELGERSISSILSLFGRIEMLAVTIPYIKEIVEMGTRLLGKGD